MEAVRKRAAHGAYGYAWIPDSFWDSAAHWMAARHGWPVRREWMILTPGVVPALSLCVTAFTRPGDKIVIQTPVYRPFTTAIENNGRRIARNPLLFDGETWRMDFEDLERKIDRWTRLLILCSPHNPVGRVWNAEELGRLGDICLEKDILVVSDEIHQDLVFRGHQAHSFRLPRSEDLAERTITLVAPSKTFNIAGFLTAVAVVSNPSLRRTLEAEAERAGLVLANVFGTVALEAAYSHGAEWLEALLQYLEGTIARTADFFRRRIPAIRFHEPEGTYLGLLDCRALGMSQKDLDAFFLEKAEVHFDAGTIFGSELEGWERINLACPRARVDEVLERIASSPCLIP
jgi:cysteine-S-conjugate beta-lyase